MRFAPRTKAERGPGSRKSIELACASGPASGKLLPTKDVRVVRRHPLSSL
jgi:hypothetical protein